MLNQAPDFTRFVLNLLPDGSDRGPLLLAAELAQMAASIADDGQAPSPSATISGRLVTAHFEIQVGGRNFLVHVDPRETI